jgi:NAD-dependent deacetylase
MSVSDLDRAAATAADAAAHDGRVIVLTGAGISAESGIPTFRGPEGYWTVGAREYQPQELARASAFARMPWEIWAWYLYRRGVCRRAQPNAAHAAIAALERALGDRFQLITQNVDGLHRRAGSARVWAIHGDLELARCADDCTRGTFPIPDGVPDLGKGETLPEPARALLRCARCGAIARPHVLWFDESYDEPRFRFESARRAAGEAALLIVVGTSAQTTLPWHVVTIAAERGATIIDVNPDDNEFARIAREHGGVAVRAAAAAAVPVIARAIGGKVSPCAQPE